MRFVSKINSEFLLLFAANDFDVDRTYEKLYQTIEWRQDHEIDTIVNENFTGADKEFPYLLDEGVDNDGRPRM